MSDIAGAQNNGPGQQLAKRRKPIVRALSYGPRCCIVLDTDALFDLYIERKLARLKEQG